MKEEAVGLEEGEDESDLSQEWEEVPKKQASADFARKSRSQKALRVWSQCKTSSLSFTSIEAAKNKKKNKKNKKTSFQVWAPLYCCA
jgi:hypothetical protein